MSKAGKIGEQKTQGKHKYSISLESGKAVWLWVDQPGLEAQNGAFTE
jgi:hypothetical protein